MEEKCSLGAGSNISFLLQSNSTNFCYNDTVLLRFTVTKKYADTFFPQAISFRSYFFVNLAVFSKKIVLG